MMVDNISELEPMLKMHPNYESLSRPIERRSYASIWLLYVLYGVSFTLVIPAMPALTLQLSNKDTVHSSLIYGIASFIRFILEFFASPFVGTFADVKGRKSVFIIAFLACGVEYLLLAIFPSIPTLLFTRALTGLGDGGVSTAYAMVTDIALYNDDVVSQQYGLLGSMLGLAFIIGPFLGGYICEYNILYCFYLSAALSMIGAVCVHFFLEETKLLKEDAQKRTSCSNYAIVVEEPPNETLSLDPLVGLRMHLSNGNICYLGLVLAIGTLSTGYHFIWYLYLSYVYHATSTSVGMYLSFHGVLSAIAQGLLLQLFIPDVMREHHAALYCFFLAAFYALGIAFAQYSWELYLISSVTCLHVIHYPAMKALIVHESMQDSSSSSATATATATATASLGLNSRQQYYHLANLQGMIGSIRTLAMAFGSLVFTSLFSYGITIGWPRLPFFLAAFLYTLAALMLVRYTMTTAIPPSLTTVHTTSTTSKELWCGGESPGEYGAITNTFFSVDSVDLNSPTSTINYQIELMEQTILSDPITTVPFD